MGCFCRYSCRGATVVAAAILWAPLLVGASLVSAPGAGAQPTTTTAPPLTTPAIALPNDWSSWNPPAPSGSAALLGSSCPSAAFCVGVGTQTVGSNVVTFVVQWDGTAWSIVPSPNPQGATGVSLRAVSCIGRNFCMAVGASGAGTLAEAWNGASWAIVPSLYPTGTSQPQLNAVSCVSPTSCYAVGTAHGASAWQTMAGYWNGKSWSLVSSPNPSGSTYNSLLGLSCVNDNFCAATGEALQGSSTVPLAENWNGVNWSIVPTATPPTSTGSTALLQSVSCVGTGFCFSVGFTHSGAASQMLIERYVRSAWSLATSPNRSTATSNTLSSVSCYSATSCAAVGQSGGSPPSTLAIQWDGVRWSVVSTPNQPSSPGTSVASVSCLTNWACVAVGGFGSGPTSSSPFSMWAPIPRSGYRLAGSDGGVYAFGPGAPFLGSMGGLQLSKPVVGMSIMPAGDGYDLVASDGGVFSFGSAPFVGSTGNITLNKPVVGMATTSDGAGYWLVASDGGVFAFGNATFYGSMGGSPINKPVVGMAATPDGKGYWLVASDGGVFSFGDASFYGSTGGITLNKPIVGMAAPTTGTGYWLVASDGGVFSFGRAPFAGSMAGTALNKPVVGMASTPPATGYWLAAADGGVFPFGASALGFGSLGLVHIDANVVAIGF